MSLVSSNLKPFLVFHDFDTFEEPWSVILQTTSQFGFVWCFLVFRLKLCILTRSKVMLCSLSLPHMGIHAINMTYPWWFNLDHLVKVVSAGFLYCDIIFPLAINLSGEILREYANIWFLFKLLLTLASTVSLACNDHCCGVCLIMLFNFSHSAHIFKLELFCKEKVSFLPCIYSFDYLYQYRLMEIYSMGFNSIWSFIFLLNLFQLSLLGALSGGLLCPFDVPLSVFHFL